MNPPFDIIIGLDRSDRSANICLIQVNSGKHTQDILDTSPESMATWVNQLFYRYPGQQIAICFEQPANNLIAWLSQYEGLMLYPINPISLQKFRETFVTSRAKDDALDARYLANLLLSHYPAFKPWHADDIHTRQLRRLVVDRRSVVQERVELTNRLQALLKDYFPQALALAGEDLWRPLACDFLLRWPSLQKLKTARTETLTRFYYAHGSRSASLLKTRLELVSKSVALVQELALVDSYVLRVQMVVRQIQQVAQTISEYDRRIASVFKAHPDRLIFESLPGCGKVFAPRLLTTLGTRRERFDSFASLLN